MRLDEAWSKALKLLKNPLLKHNVNTGYYTIYHSEGTDWDRTQNAFYPILGSGKSWEEAFKTLENTHHNHPHQYFNNENMGYKINPIC